MDGNATFTMLVSSTIIRSPSHSTYSASQRACLWFMVSPASGGLSPSPRTDLTGYDNSSQRISCHPSCRQVSYPRPAVRGAGEPGTDKDGGGSRSSRGGSHAQVHALGAYRPCRGLRVAPEGGAGAVRRRRRC